MSIEKSEFKAAVIHEVGVRISDIEEVASKQTVEQEGRVKGLQEAEAAIRSIYVLVDEDLTSGAVPDLEAAKLIKKFLVRAEQKVNGAMMRALGDARTAHGAFLGLQKAAKLVKEMHQAEQQKGKISQIREEQGTLHRSIKEERLKEEQCQTGSSSPQQQPLPVSAPTSSAPAAEKSTTTSKKRTAKTSHK